mgnify:CR=1 FL=1
MNTRSPIELLAGYKLGTAPLWSYTPVPEIPLMRMHRFREELGVWDTLGSYDPEAGIIKIYEREIAAVRLEGRIGYPMLRELVRLHEHSHAFLHRAQLSLQALSLLLASTKLGVEQVETLVIEAALVDQREWYPELPRGVLEPLTELVKQVALAWALGRRGLELARRAEEELNVPSYYRRWRDLEGLINSFQRQEPLLAVILYTARSREWRDWSSLRDRITRLVKDAGGPGELEACQRLGEWWLSLNGSHSWQADTTARA